MKPPKVIALCDVCLAPIHKKELQTIEVLTRSIVKHFEAFSFNKEKTYERVDLCLECFSPFVNKFFRLMRGGKNLIVIERETHEAHLKRIQDLEKLVVMPPYPGDLAGSDGGTGQFYVSDEQCLHKGCSGCKNGTCNGVHMLSCPFPCCSPRM